MEQQQTASDQLKSLSIIELRAILSQSISQKEEQAREPEESSNRLRMHIRDLQDRQIEVKKMSNEFVLY